MDIKNTISEDFQKGYIQGITAVFSVILNEMDDRLKEIIFENLKLKKYE